MSNKFEPVRKIGKSCTALSGTISPLENNDRSIYYESSLERDFIIMMNFDPSVETIIEQPVQIDYTNSSGLDVHYTPDFLVFYRNNLTILPYKNPTMIEVKYEEDLIMNRIKYQEKFERAKEFCNEQGYDFEVWDEHMIRTEYLENAKFLKSYENGSNADPGICAEILNKIIGKKNSTVKEILTFDKESKDSD